MEQDKPNILPWWQKAKVVTFLGSIVVAVMPITTYVGGYIQKETELALNEQKLSHEIRMDYINRALTPNMTEAEKELIFALFVEMEDQPELQRWGKKHHASLVSKIDALEQRLKDKEKQKATQEAIVKESDKTGEELENTIAEKTANNAPKADIDALNEKLRLERENAEAALEKLQELREKTEELRVRVGEPAEIKILKQVKANKLVDKFMGSERKVASSELVALYEIDPKSVIDALIDGIILDQSDKRSYRVNLYIAYTLAKLPSKWRGSTEQKKKIEGLKKTRNYINDKTFKRRIDQALENYTGT